MTTDKPWDRPWSMDEIIAQADNWSLAGDVALLNTLKRFADNLLTKTTEIDRNLNKQLNNLEEVGLQLNIAQNSFQSLRNTQFIESRVYEDDETLPQTEDKVEPKVEEGDRIDEIRAAAQKGLDVLDTYFDKVSVSVSDSEDEDIELPKYILRPKDLYINRPLPYVIGSDEWHKNWHVGLADSSSDSESEKVSDKYSDSDSDLTVSNSQIKGASDTSSELDFSQQPEANANATSDVFSSSEGEEQNSNNFAQQLAAKLVNIEEEINRRPIQNVNSQLAGDLFFDEPPPLEDNKGMFSGGAGLFDDDEGVAPTHVTRKPGLDIFDEESSDEDIFQGTNRTQTIKPPPFSEEPPELKEKKKPIGGVSPFGGIDLFGKDSSQPTISGREIEEKQTKKKIDLFGDSDPTFDNVPKKGAVSKPTKKVRLFDSDEEDVKVIEQPSATNKPKTSHVEKKSHENYANLFDDDLFSLPAKKKFTSGLFDDVDDQEEDLFFEKSDKKTKNGLFEDLLSIPDDGNSINVDAKVENFVDSKEGGVTSRSLFDSPPPEPERLFKNEATEVRSLFDSPPPEPERLLKNEATEVRSLFDSPPPEPERLLKNEATEVKSGNLFDSPPPEPEDLFANKQTLHSIFDDLFEANTRKEKTNSGNDLLVGTPVDIPKTSPVVPLFDSTPPPDDWNIKSDDFFTEQEAPKTSLFGDEPPSLDFNNKVSDLAQMFQKGPPEEIKIHASPGKVKHNLSINVGALVPGTAPPKLRQQSENKTFVPEDDGRNVETGAADDTDVEVLHSVTKDRAKIPFHRRPSTRKGRKATLQKAKNTTGGADLNPVSDFEREQEWEKFPDRVGSVVKTSRPMEVPSGGLFDDEREQHNIENPNLEGPGALGDGDLAKTVKMAEPVKDAASGLFDDDDDDLFSSRKAPAQPVAKKSLFDDDNDEDDDDIFKVFGAANATKKTSSSVAVRRTLKVNTKKLKNTTPDEDPLSALLK